MPESSSGERDVSCREAEHGVPILVISKLVILHVTKALSVDVQRKEPTRPGRERS